MSYSSGRIDITIKRFELSGNVKSQTYTNISTVSKLSLVSQHNPDFVFPITDIHEASAQSSETQSCVINSRAAQHSFSVGPSAARYPLLSENILRL